MTSYCLWTPIQGSLESISPCSFSEQASSPLSMPQAAEAPRRSVSLKLALGGCDVEVVSLAQVASLAPAEAAASLRG